MDKNNKLTVEFTKEQFFSLMKAVYLGNWMANAARMDTKDFKKDYEQILDYIFSLAPKFGLEKYMDHDSFDQEKYLPSREFEEKTDVEILSDEYDEEVFWNEISDRFGSRDFTRAYGENKIGKMSDEERAAGLCRSIEEWSKEFEDHGLERLEIKQKI